MCERREPRVSVTTSKTVCLLILFLGIARYRACSKLMPNSTTQPFSMYREPVHFPYLMTNGRCIVASEISSSEYAGSII